jgi:hypothetical protein
MTACRHPGYHRRREQRLLDEEAQRAFERQQRAHLEATAAARRLRLPAPEQQAFISELTAAGRAVLARLPYH